MNDRYIEDIDYSDCVIIIRPKYRKFGLYNLDGKEFLELIKTELVTKYGFHDEDKPELKIHFLGYDIEEGWIDYQIGE